MDPLAITWDVACVALYGGLVALDRRSAFQVMISQPLICVSILGLAFGYLELAFGVAVLLQLLWMSSVLFGANVPPNDTIASVVIAGILLLYAKVVVEPSAALICMAILFGVPISLLGKRLDIRVDRINLDLARMADRAVVDNRLGRISRIPMIALMRSFAVGAALVFIFVALGLGFLIWIADRLSQSMVDGLMVSVLYLIPALGLAVSLSLVRKRRALALSVVTFVLVTTFFGQGGG